MTRDYRISEVSRGRIREVTAAGRPRELGLHYGRAASDLIAEVYELRMHVASRGTAVPAVLDRAMTYAPFVQRYAPELLEEVHGIGEGAGIGFERAFFLQVASEMEPTSDRGCSSLATSTAPSGPIVAQNWDTSRDYLGKEVVLRLRPEGKPRLLMFAIAGVIGYVGLNEYGVGQVSNSLYLDDRRPGLTGYFMMRKFLEASSVSEVTEWLHGVEVGSNGNYLVADAAGNVVDIELGGGAVRTLQHPVQVHTNHYTAKGWDVNDKAATVLPDSYGRYVRLAELVGDGASRERAIGALQDHDGAPVGICRHEAAPGLMTTASVVHDLRAREMLVCQGNPCRGSYRRFPLTEPSAADDVGRRAEW